jgi:esterase/lipase
MIKRLLITFSVLLTITAVICFYFLSGHRVSQSMFLPAGINKKDESTQWFTIKRSTKNKGVALVVHGLNLRPERMQSIITVLNDAGIDVLNLSLRGHGNNYAKNINVSIDNARLESFRNVSYGEWLDEMYRAYVKVRERAAKKKVPVFFIGYSLGGLMGCNLALSHPDVVYDRMVLFAPALNVTVRSYLLKVLMPFPNLVIDSLSPASYRSNEGTPMAAYRALFEAAEYLKNNISDKINIPTILFIDEKDEFISYSSLQEMIERKHLSHWHIHMVRKDLDVEGKMSNHLIINQESVGENMWKQIEDILIKHLNARS